MNKTIFEGKWKQIRGKSKEWWSLINDLDLSRIDKATEKLERYVVLLQVKEDAGEVGKTVLAQ